MQNIAYDPHMRDPLTEDLRALAHSGFGQRLIAGDVEALDSFPMVRERSLTQTAQQLATLLAELV